MKKIIIVVAILVAIIATGYGSAVAVNKAYQEYVRTSEELLWELERMCEQNGLPWGDTICEGCIWEDYNSARVNLGLGELEYYGNVKGL